MARFGGDEFGLLLWVPDDETAAAILQPGADRVAGRARPRRPAHAHGQRGLPAGRPRRHSPLPCPAPKSLYQAADAALREAKQQGRDRTVGHGGDDCLR